MRIRSMEAQERTRKYNREYQRQRMAESEEYRDKCRKTFAKIRWKRYVEASETVRQWKTQGCLVCGEHDECCIDAHHANPASKEYAVGSLIALGKRPEVIMQELEKCIPLCANCHRKYHFGVADVVESVTSQTGVEWVEVQRGKPRIVSDEDERGRVCEDQLLLFPVHFEE